MRFFLMQRLLRACTGNKLLICIILFYFFRKFKAEGIQIRINLAIALFLAQVVFLSGIDATNNKVCILFREFGNFENHSKAMSVQ